MVPSLQTAMPLRQAVLRTRVSVQMAVRLLEQMSGTSAGTTMLPWQPRLEDTLSPAVVLSRSLRVSASVPSVVLQEGTVAAVVVAQMAVRLLEQVSGTSAGTTTLPWQPSVSLQEGTVAAAVVARLGACRRLVVETSSVLTLVPLSVRSQPLLVMSTSQSAMPQSVCVC